MFDLRWYDHAFGGKKAFQGLVAAGLGVMAWFTIPQEARVTNLLQFLGYWLICLSVYVYSNLKTKKINNGGDKK